MISASVAAIFVWFCLLFLSSLNSRVVDVLDSVMIIDSSRRVSASEKKKKELK